LGERKKGPLPAAVPEEKKKGTHPSTKKRAVARKKKKGYLDFLRGEEKKGGGALTLPGGDPGLRSLWGERKKGRRKLKLKEKKGEMKASPEREIFSHHIRGEKTRDFLAVEEEEGSSLDKGASPVLDPGKEKIALQYYRGKGKKKEKKEKSTKM